MSPYQRAQLRTLYRFIDVGVVVNKYWLKLKSGRENWYAVDYLQELGKLAPKLQYYKNDRPP